MKKILIILALLFFASSMVYAVEDVVYKAKNGDVTFHHELHGELVKCTGCHQGKPAKIEVNKNLAHGAACKDCHVAMAGPTKCNDCHKK